MAQDRKFNGQNRVAGDYSYDSTGDSELFCQYRGSVLEVGGARLFEAPRSGVTTIPRFSDTTDDDAKCDDGARCDSGAYYTSENRSKPNNTDNARYKPNTSRRRQLLSQQGKSCVGDPATIRGHPQSFGPAGKPRKDWEELRGLSQILIFEALELVLILGLIIVRIGAALAKGISLWLDEGMLKAPGLRHKNSWRNTEKEGIQGGKTYDNYRTDQDRVTNDNTDFTDDQKGFTDLTGPVWTRKQLQSSVKSSTDCKRSVTDKDLRSTYQRPSAIMADTGSASSTGSSDPIQTTVTMPAMLYMPMPPPGTLGSPMFEGANISEFLERYEDLCSNYRVSDEDRLTRLPRYCIQPVAETIKSLKEWKGQDYAALKKVLLAEYRNDDTRQLLYSVPFLESYKNITRTEKDDIMDYCRKFDRIAQHCMDKKVLTEYTAGVWFIHGLPPPTASKLI